MPDITDSLDDGSAIERMMRRFYPDLIEDAYLDAARSGLAVSFDLENPYNQTVINRRAQQVRNVSDTTKDEIRRLLSLQSENGWSSEDLARMFESLADTRSKTRALLIARTETAAMYSEGSIAAYKASGVVKGLEWLTADDELTCEICAPLNGTRTDLDGAFAEGVSFPPAHPACRCAIAPIVE